LGGWEDSSKGVRLRSASQFIKKERHSGREE
jgi:hypothetical protein